MKEKIVKKALDLFARYGIKWVNMNQISKELGISKKTLYEFFASKDELVSEAIETSLMQMKEKLAGEENQSTSHIETVLQESLTAYNHVVSFCPAFYKDIHFYHDAWAKITRSREELKYLFLNHFEQGVKEGVFIAGENYTTIAFLFAELIGNHYPQFQTALMLTLLRGVCTEKGIGELHNYQTLINNIHQPQPQYKYDNV